MLKSFLTLDLPIDALDQEIRQQYLKLVKQFSPERYPEKFRSITSAYESVKDKRSRVKSRLFSVLKTMDTEEALRSLGDSVKIKKKRTTLNKLIKAAKE